MSENDNETEKPLKKAKYMWQVKGKYHLKDSLKNNALNINMLEPGICTSSASTSKVPLSHNTLESEIATIKKCCIASVLATTEAIMDEIAVDNSSCRNQAIQNAACLPPSKRERLNSANEDYFIKKWQALQRARCFVDNTVNSVLENWMNPHSIKDDYERLGLNLFDTIKSKNGQLEDDAILMAIQSHGLSCAPDYYVTNSNFSEDNLTNIHAELGRMETEVDYNENQKQDSKEFSMEFVEKEELDGIEPVVNKKVYQDCERDLEVSSMDFLQQAVSAAIQEKGLLY